MLGFLHSFSFQCKCTNDVNCWVTFCHGNTVNVTTSQGHWPPLLLLSVNHWHSYSQPCSRQKFSKRMLPIKQSHSWKYSCFQKGVIIMNSSWSIWNPVSYLVIIIKKKKKPVRSIEESNFSLMRIAARWQLSARRITFYEYDPKSLISVQASSAAKL